MSLSEETKVFEKSELFADSEAPHPIDDKNWVRSETHESNYIVKADSSQINSYVRGFGVNIIILKKII